MFTKSADFYSSGNADYKKWEPTTCNVQSYLRIFRILLKKLYLEFSDKFQDRVLHTKTKKMFKQTRVRK